MAKETSRPKARQGKVRIADLKAKSAARVKGGALTAYLKIEGTKSSETK